MSANAYKRAVEEMEGNIARSIVSPCPCFAAARKYSRGKNRSIGRTVSSYRPRPDRKVQLLLARSPERNLEAREKGQCAPFQAVSRQSLVVGPIK